MKRVVSVSLGSSKRNHRVEIELLGEPIVIERIGTDGDMKKAVELIKELDGQVDAFGLGGTDLYIHAGNRRYLIREAASIARAAVKAPIVDGSGLKNTLERKVIAYLREKAGMVFQDKNVLMVCGVDRFGMAESLEASGARMLYGDLIFALGVPVPLRSLNALHWVARIAAPLVCQLPFKYLYPTGDKQEDIKPKYSKYYYEADIIAGDFHFVKKFLPPRLEGKTIITNTVTTVDLDMMKKRGIDTLITTTPEINGRSFGTNVMEALLIALSGQRPEEITSQYYDEMMDRLGFVPRIEKLQETA
ncbi:MAG TPA: quinate 5-dehydrogenase [Clostridia bacterium]|nr:quinate 5-dehydrogenase [Clostridia bacterium]